MIVLVKSITVIKLKTFTHVKIHRKYDINNEFIIMSSVSVKSTITIVK